MIQWQCVAEVEPPAWKQCVVACKSSIPDSPIYTIGLYDPESKQWIMSNPYYAKTMTHWAELTPPEIPA
jgi:hypothetical protein